jgi:hypothetical protein
MIIDKTSVFILYILKNTQYKIVSHRINAIITHREPIEYTCSSNRVTMSANHTNYVNYVRYVTMERQ